MCSSKVDRTIILSLIVASFFPASHSFTPFPLPCTRQQILSHTVSATLLTMAKSINKQAELRRKLELAKQQKQQPDSNEGDQGERNNNNPTTKINQRLSDQQVREENDRKRFAQLLKQSTATAVWNDYASADDYKNYQQLEEEIDAQRRGVDRLFEGDPAPEECFATLIDSRTDQPLGTLGRDRIVPWLGKSSTRNSDDNDYMIIVCDPRPESPDLQTAASTLWTELPADLKQRLLFINADSVAQNRRWFKKQAWGASSAAASGPTVYCDTSKTWMRSYTALGDKRWSMTLFVLAHGRVQKLVRDMDVYTITKVVAKAVAAYKEAKL